GHGQIARGCVATDKRQFEADLVEPVTRTELPERHVVDERTERGLDRRCQPGDPGVKVSQVDPAPGQLRFDPTTELFFRRYRGEVGAFQHPVDERTDVHAAGQV